MILSAIATNGTLAYDQNQPEKIKSWLNQREGNKVYVTFNEKRPSRTLDQNSYYWAGIIGTISDWSGDDPKSEHDRCKEKWCPRFFNSDGEPLERTTTRLTTKEFSTYIDRITEYFGREHNLAFPTADDV